MFIYPMLSYASMTCSIIHPRMLHWSLEAYTNMIEYDRIQMNKE